MYMILLFGCLEGNLAKVRRWCR